jgi:phage minor structural protein
MYTIYADDQILYSPILMQDVVDPADIGQYAVKNPKLTVELNKAGSCSFVISPTNMMYHHLHRLKTVIRVEEDGSELWSGRILDTNDDYYNHKSCMCEGRLAFLNDSQVRPYYFTGTPASLFEQMITNHNSRVDDWKQFKIGNCDITDGDVSNTNNQIIRYVTQYGTNTLQEMTSKLWGSSLGGYVRIRKESDGYYLDWMTEAGPVSDQIIEFGENLLDLKKIVDTSNVFTIIIPTGKTEESEGSEQQTVTIESVNDGKDYIESTAGISLFGRIEKVVEWEDVSLPENLLTKGQKALQEGILSAITMECTAVDMRLLGVDVSSFHLGNRIRLVSVPHDIDEYFVCSKIEYDLERPQNNKYTLGAVVTSLTGRSASNAVIRGY